MSKSRYKTKQIIKIINNKTKLVVGAYLFSKKKAGYTYHELLSNKWIVKRFRFHILYAYVISPQSVAVFATSGLVGCGEYQYNSLEDKVDKSAVATSYQVGWIDYTLQDILGQKF